MAIRIAAPANNYVGLSTDTKPVGVGAGSKFYEEDTSDVYVYDGNSWELDTPSGIKTTILHNVASTLGASQSIKAGKDKTLQVIITGSATVEWQISNDNQNWETIATATNSGAFENSGKWAYTRTEITAYTSGTVTTILGQ